MKQKLEVVGLIGMAVGVILLAIFFSLVGFENPPSPTFDLLWLAAFICFFGGGALVIFFGEGTPKKEFEYPRLMTKSGEGAQS